MDSGRGNDGDLVLLMNIKCPLPKYLIDRIIQQYAFILKLHVIMTKGNNDRDFERDFATCVIMDIILPPWYNNTHYYTGSKFFIRIVVTSQPIYECNYYMAGKK